ncbi:hypothetical protein [Jeotgalibaca porci]|uniref:hypothetical protein n=1 Tax=Jeotgalibaca porci TaxID=1868793 RepID=UPI00359F2090
MKKQVPSYKSLHPLKWEIMSIGKKIKEEGIKASEAYPQDVYLALTNKYIKARWSFQVRCRIEYIDVLNDDWEKVVEMEYKINSPMPLKAASDLLTIALREEIKEDFFGTTPDTIHIEAIGFVQLGNTNVRPTNRTRRKNR